MNRREFIASAIALGMTASVLADAPSAAIPFETFKSYFVLNTIHPEKGQNCKCGICTTHEQFEALFHPAAVMFSRQKFIDPDYFNDHVILYWIEWGNTPWDYEVKSVMPGQNGLVVQYTRQGEPSNSAFFSPHLLVGVEKTALANGGEVTFQLKGK